MVKFKYQTPWKVEYAKSWRSSCMICKRSIRQDELRFGKMVRASQFDGFMPRWHHAACIVKKKTKQIHSIHDVEGFDLLRWEDQQKIRKYVESFPDQAAKTNALNTELEYSIEVSQTSRATCRHCCQRILQGEVRICTKPDGLGSKVLAWHHANCFIEISPSIQPEQLLGWGTLPESDQIAICALVKEVPSTVEKGKKVEVQEGRDFLNFSFSRVARKRRIHSGGNPKSKAVKTVEDVSNSMGEFITEDQHPKASELESNLEVKTKELWALKDDLKKHVTTAELRKMLEANGQDSTGSELGLRNCCADGMMFGALASCPICSCSLRYSGGIYQCHGYLSAWSKCSFSTHEPKRLKGKWKVPENTNSQYLSNWFKSQKVGKPALVLPSTSFSITCGIQASDGQSQLSKNKSLADLRVTMFGFPHEVIEEWKRRIEGAGGVVRAKIRKDTNCVILSGLLDDRDVEVWKARRMNLPFLREDYLVDCFEKQRKLTFDLYKASTFCQNYSTVTVRIKGQSVVEEYSGLQDRGHILEDGNSIYNTTLNMSDLSTGVNSFYMLQIIQLDRTSQCHLFRKWGRVGEDDIERTKLEDMSKSKAICEFKRLFQEKTGNPWEAWEQNRKFQKKPGKYFPLDIGYGVNKQMWKTKTIKDCKLAPPLADLMKMLFDVETYRAAMMELEINLSEMPLGKLSKSNIQKGFEALTEIQNLLNSNTHDCSIKESLLVDASNRFFTVIPSTHPHVIRDKDDFKLKVKMLEALQDIEIASKLVGFDADADADINESLDDKYKRLRCQISPLPRDSQDYKLIEKYLLTTHAPTHKDWTLKLDEVFSLEREGENDRFASYQKKLSNKMLLWHGSRLTNFVGILSQGLRIAPPEAPTTGYMFGKGIYFADLVSKSAQYCGTCIGNPVGLLLLSEVALGKVNELKKAEYMENPPEGKHSTKGLGNNMPRESEHVKWRDDVIVPCGKPVASRTTDSDLIYNEYIVYDTAQVKLQFLLKVKFQYKW